MLEKEIEFMNLAFKEARLALQENEVPVGAVVVYDGKVVAKAHNKTNQNNSCIDHAEILAIKKAMKKLKTNRLDDCNIFVTLEPCLMCSGAISLAHIKKVFYAAKDEKFGSLISSSAIYEDIKLPFKPEVYFIDMANKEIELLQEFFKNKRE